MERRDYEYHFKDITDVLRQVQVTDHRINKNFNFSIAVNDSQFLFKRYHQISARLADLVDIATTVDIADRLSIAKEGLSRSIRIILPVRQPEIFSRDQFLEQLQEILYWYTDDHWEFKFTKRTAPGRLSEIQKCLVCAANSNQLLKVALWSGGLDSLAGLYNQLRADPSAHYILLGAGRNSTIQNAQKKLAEATNALFPGRTTLIQLPIQVGGTKNFEKSSTQRSRGFVFSLLGAICAYLEEQDTLYLYENGTGAINLPFRESEVGLDHTRSVNPLSLFRMSGFVSQLFEMPFTIQNPFLFKTKAQMCEVFTTLASTDLISDTITCDSLHRKKEEPIQCGYCSSCLLRRQALTVAGIKDPTSYGIFTRLQNGTTKPSDGDHLRAMLDQVSRLHSLLSTPAPWKNMSKQYTILATIVEQMTQLNGEPPEKTIQSLLQLYERYVHEWDSVKDNIGQSLLETKHIGTTT